MVVLQNRETWRAASLQQPARSPSGSWVKEKGRCCREAQLLRGCGPRHTEERRKAARAVHCWCAALELRRTRRGVARIPLWGNSNSGSTSEAARGKKGKSGAPVRSVFRAADETEAGALGR
ncbi:hypothetical protein NDU88_008374 [Pleurodeles waltl]|uniref:Uncharacterized protein n=1 Tax=Pleurodeles waltl TaxID=8319 RepID=A0AAV7QRK8_PLEWA|nr:hypothetical protein NDU88_008374 [Pleurodeles waltl]